LNNLDKTQRAEVMYQMHIKEYRTLTAIGKKFGLTKERVRQIVNKYKEGLTHVQDIRTARNGEDNNVAEQSGRSTGARNTSQ